MYDRIALKEKGKKSFRSNYGQSVVVALLSFAVPLFFSLLIGALAPTLIGNILAVLFTLLYFCICYLLRVGATRFFVRNIQERARVRELLEPFRNGCSLSTIIAMFATQLLIMLWSLLLIVPGVIRSYDYYLVPFLLAERPDMKGREARSLSREWMRGYKRRLFVMDLSFAGWILLEIATLGIAGIFYVTPYINSAHAEFYVFLRDQTRSSVAHGDSSDQQF